MPRAETLTGQIYNLDHTILNFGVKFYMKSVLYLGFDVPIGAWIFIFIFIFSLPHGLIYKNKLSQILKN